MDGNLQDTRGSISGTSTDGFPLYLFVWLYLFSSISLKLDDLLNRNVNKRGIVPRLCYFVAHLESLRTKLSLLNSNSALNEACRMIVTWLTADVELLLWVTFTLTLVLFLWKKSRMKNFKIFYFLIFLVDY